MALNSSSGRRASENIFGMTFDVRNPFVDMPKKPLDDFNGFHQLAMTHISMTGLGLTIQQWCMEPHHASVFLATFIQDCNQLQPLNPDFASEICNEWGKFDPHSAHLRAFRAWLSEQHGVSDSARRRIDDGGEDGDNDHGGGGGSISSEGGGGGGGADDEPDSDDDPDFVAKKKAAEVLTGFTRSGKRFSSYADEASNGTSLVSPRAEQSRPVKSSSSNVASGGGIDRDVEATLPTGVGAGTRKLDFRMLRMPPAPGQGGTTSDTVNDTAFKIFRSLHEDIREATAEFKRFHDLLLKHMYLIVKSYTERTGDSRTEGALEEWATMRHEIEKEQHKSFFVRITQCIPWGYLFKQFLKQKFSGIMLTGETVAQVLRKLTTLHINNTQDMLQLEHKVRGISKALMDEGCIIKPDAINMILLNALEHSSLGAAKQAGKGIRDQFTLNERNGTQSQNTFVALVDLVKKYAYEAIRRGESSSEQSKSSKKPSSGKHVAAEHHQAHAVGHDEVIGSHPENTCRTCGHRGHRDEGYKHCPKTTWNKQNRGKRADGHNRKKHDKAKAPNQVSYADDSDAPDSDDETSSVDSNRSTRSNANATSSNSKKVKDGSSRNGGRSS